MKNHSQIIFLCFFIIITNSCRQNKEQESWRHIELSPLDESQVITVITKDKKRYFMNGHHDEVPPNDYLLLDLSEVDQLGDGISVCWNDAGYKWKIASSYAILIENRLDTTKYLYYEPLGEYGQPISKGYEEPNCGGMLIRENLGPRGDLRVKYRKCSN